MIEAIFFYVFASVLLLSGVMVISSRNPVHSVLWLILSFFNAAGLFIMLGAEFIAMLMVIVYVGAVAVLFLFVVMMLDIDLASLKTNMRKHLVTGGIVGGVLLAEVIWLYTTWQTSDGAAHRIAQPIPDPTQITNTHALGHVLYTHYVYLFQISGLILLVSMIGAITLTHRRRDGVHKQNIGEQLDRTPEDVIRIEQIETGAGVT